MVRRRHLRVHRQNPGVVVRTRSNHPDCFPPILQLVLTRLPPIATLHHIPTLILHCILRFQLTPPAAPRLTFLRSLLVILSLMPLLHYPNLG